MSEHALPRLVDARRAIKKELHLQGFIEVSNFNRWAPLLADNSGVAYVNMLFGRDDTGLSLLKIETSCDLDFTCQRCLERVNIEFNCSSNLAIIFKGVENHSFELPARLEPLITDEMCDTWIAVEDELILSLPSYPYHPDGKCSIPALNSSIDTSNQNRESLAGPFSALGELISRKHIDGE